VASGNAASRMRGRYRRAQNRGTAPSPDHLRCARRSTSPRTRGEVKPNALALAARLFAPRLNFQQPLSNNPRRNPDLRQINPAVERPEGSRSGHGELRRVGEPRGLRCCLAHPTKLASGNKRKQNAEKRCFLNRCTSRCSARLTIRARLSAFHCGSRQGDVGPQGSASGHASGDLAGAHDPMDRLAAKIVHRSTGVTRAVLSPSSEHLARRS
jgi:hypothetical protein